MLDRPRSFAKKLFAKGNSRGFLREDTTDRLCRKSNDSAPYKIPLGRTLHLDKRDLMFNKVTEENPSANVFRSAVQSSDRASPESE